MRLRLEKRISTPLHPFTARDENGQQHTICFFDDKPFGVDPKSLQGRYIECELVPYTEQAIKPRLIEETEP